MEKFDGYQTSEKQILSKIQGLTSHKLSGIKIDIL